MISAQVSIRCLVVFADTRYSFQLPGLDSDSIKSGFVSALDHTLNIEHLYSDEGRTWLMHLCISTLVGPWRFISGSICPSNPFERHRRFTSLSKRATSSQNFWRHSNTDAPDGSFHRQFARGLAKWKRSFRTDWLHQAPFQNFRPVNLRSQSNWSVRYPDWSLMEATCTFHMTCPVDNETIGHGFCTMCVLQTRNTKHTYTIWKLEQDLEHVPQLQPVRTSCGGISSKTFGSSKMRTLFRTRPSAVHA